MDTYFANADIEELPSEIIKRVEDYQQFLVTSGRLRLWQRSYDFYYKTARNGSKLNKSGEQGEYTSINVNHYRNLLLHLKTMTTQQRPAFEPRATNTDYKSQAQTILAAGLLDYYMREQRLERNVKTAVEHGLVFGEGFVRNEWDTSLGELYTIDPEDDSPIRQGDIRYTNFTPLNVARDYTKQDATSHEWYILTSYRNRYALAAKYPDLAEKILDLPSAYEMEYKLTMSSSLGEDTDDIPVYEFYHEPNDAVPNGKLTVCLSDDIVLLDGDLPYRDLPVYRLSPEDQIDTCFGYTVGFDLIPVQEAIDGLYSTVITNQSTFGVQNIAIPQGHNLSVTQVSGGLNLIEYDSKLGKPEALNLTDTPAEIFNFITQLEHLSETLSGVNSVARGNPEASLKSGSALALVQSMAIQFSIGLQQSYVSLLEDLGTSTINILRDFANSPRIAIVAGKSQRSMLNEFTGDDLGLVNRVTVDMGNALARTTAGKVQLAENLLQNGLIKTPEEYIMVLSTGRLEPAIEGLQSELLNIKAENEDLSIDKHVPVMITDQHQIHIQEHKSILASPEARRNPELIRTVLSHIQEHINALSDPANAQILAVLQQQPLPPQQMNSNVQGKGPNAQVLDPSRTVEQKADSVNMPNMPKNALTGEESNPLQEPDLETL